MREFDHFILTRYSVVFAPDEPPVPEDWLRYRLGFFVEACLASVVSQTSSNLRWLVFADDRCSDEFRRDFDELAEGRFEPVWTHEPFYDGVFREAVAERSSTPYLITTRLDSDDALASDFVASVQAQFQGQDRLFVNFGRGLQMDRTGSVYRYDYMSNPFVSLIEKRVPDQPPLTVFGSRAHGRVRGLGPLREVVAPPMWLQVVHGGNLANSIRGPRVAPSVVARRFEIELDHRRALSLPRLAREKLVQRGRLTRLRVTRPNLALEWLQARYNRLRGTHDKAQWPAGRRSVLDRVRRRRA